MRSTVVTRADKRAGRAVGTLYIVGTVAGILSVAAFTPVNDAATTLGGVTDHPNAIPLSAIAVLVMGLSLAMIPLVAYPILRTHSPLLARGYIVFRSGFEGVTYLLTAIEWLLLIPLADDMANGADGTALSPIADALLAGQGLGSVATIVFVVGAAMFYTVLWRARLVPRWISGWGLLGLVPYLAAGALALTDTLDPLSGAATALDIPLAIQEMVLAVYLVTKGFRSVNRSTP